jgi:hypothetical protein
MLTQVAEGVWVHQSELLLNTPLPFRAGTA